MTTASGLGAQLGAKKETTYGTYVAADHFPDFVDESLQNDYQRIESKSMRSGGRAMRSNRRIVNVKGPKGGTTLEVQSSDMGIWFEQAFGQSAITTPPSGVLARLQTFTVGDDPGSLSIQVGRPDSGGVCRPYSYLGSICTDWELSCDVDGILTMKQNWDCQAQDVTQTLAAYVTPSPFPELLTYVGGTVTLAAGALDVTKFNVKVDNKKDTGRYFLKTGGLKKKPVPNDFIGVSGSVDIEFGGTAQEALMLSGAVGTLVATFQGSLIETVAGPISYFNTFKLTLGAVMLDGDTPTVSGPGIIEHTLNFTGLDDGTNPIIKGEYYTVDTTL